MVTKAPLYVLHYAVMNETLTDGGRPLERFISDSLVVTNVRTASTHARQTHSACGRTRGQRCFARDGTFSLGCVSLSFHWISGRVRLSARCLNGRTTIGTGGRGQKRGPPPSLNQNEFLNFPQVVGERHHASGRTGRRGSMQPEQEWEESPEKVIENIIGDQKDFP